ncbi:MAG: hypothetical protein SWY16_10145 [Cyanobacteriota bacterium]|nr:hypothetical protein [Cyanobacteriota bacterium]
MFKLFGSKQKESYFLEFDDASETQSAQPEQPPAPVAPSKAKTSEPITEEAVRAVDKAVQPVKEEASIATESAEPTKKKKAKKAKAKKAQQETPAPAPAAPKPAPKKEPEPVVLFAPNYLMPTPTNTRRRPSANMRGFLDMAKDMKRR